MSPAFSPELDALRRRAYGPDADIQSDAAAVARLRELEQQAAPPAAVVPTRSPRDAPPVVVGEPPRHLASPAADAPTPDDAPRPWWRRPAVLIAGLAVALVVVLATALLVSAGDSRSDRTLTATAPDAEIPFPDGFQWLTQALGISRDALRSYRGIGEIVVWAGRSRDGINCLLVTGPDSPFGFGCSRDGHDATADIVLDSDMASIPRTDLPERTTIRFVYRGDRVDVWISEPPRSSPSP